MDKQYLTREEVFGEFGIPEPEKMAVCPICRKKTKFERVDPSCNRTDVYMGGYPLAMYCCTHCGIVIGDVDSAKKFKKIWEAR